MPIYSRNDVIDAVHEALNDSKAIYKSRFANIRGITSVTKELLTEVFAAELLQENARGLWADIPAVTRAKGYRVREHTGKVTTGINNEASNRKEERFAIKLFNLCNQNNFRFQDLGTIFDYQVPLKNERKDEGLGKIDLVSKTEDRIWLIELKKKDSKETALRCALEIATYYQIIDKQRFLDSYDHLNNYKTGDIKKCILIFEDSLQYHEIQEMHKGERPSLQMLFSELEVEVFTVNDEADIKKL